MKFLITSAFARSPADFVGQHVALWSPVNMRFMQMHENENAGKSSGFVGVLQDEKINPGNLEEWRTWERFEVVDAGNGQIALHHTLSNRFLRLFGEDVDGFGGVQGNTLPAGWEFERFTVVPVANGTVALHNARNNKFIRMVDGCCVDAKGGLKNTDELPAEWRSEQWEVILHPLDYAAHTASAAASANATPLPEAAPVEGEKDEWMII
ncbi:hypothetical protein B484DRAFT_447169 [Ochromonadaceae sp. CCMP2298]|nr:hypothetical protein B484DRAFT_447169 [Ochromonadaceae sp. CCMP2298]